MAISDYLKPLLPTQAPVINALSGLNRGRNIAAPTINSLSTMQASKPASQSLNLGLGASRAAAMAPLTSRPVTLQPVASPRIGASMPTPAIPQAPADPNALARQRLEQEAQNLGRTGSAFVPASPVAPQPSPTQTTTDQGLDEETLPELQAAPRFADVYRGVYDQLGLGDIRSQIEKSGNDLQELQDKKVDEISLVNENPWLTEGQRQDRVNAINRKYEQRESNLVNRLQLFQSTFEQGRQEAQFIAQQQAQEQRADLEFQRGLIESEMDARRKLQAAGDEVLSVADATSLGVPFGTTIAEARRMGITPEAEQELESGMVGEYQFYERQERAAGREPLSFDEYQTRDANRKLRAASAAGGRVGGDLTKLLSVEEALKLGVPYGTTKGQAVGLYVSGASGEAAKLRGIVNTLPSEIEQLRSILTGAGRVKMAEILSGADAATGRLIDQVADKVGRLRSGGAINKDEENRFKAQLLRKADLITGNTASALNALNGLEQEASQVAQGIRVPPAPTSAENMRSKYNY